MRNDLSGLDLSSPIYRVLACGREFRSSFTFMLFKDRPHTSRACGAVLYLGLKGFSCLGFALPAILVGRKLRSWILDAASLSKCGLMLFDLPVDAAEHP